MTGLSVLGPGPKETLCLEAKLAESVKVGQQTMKDKQQGLREAGRKNLKLEHGVRERQADTDKRKTR